MFYWDKSTGILVEANSSFTDYTMNTKADKTNMWQPQIFGLDPTVFYALVIAVAAILAVIAFFFIRRKKRALWLRLTREQLAFCSLLLAHVPEPQQTFL
jgi:hypothetical protein